MFRNGASHAAAPSAFRNGPCRAKSAFDPPRPCGTLHGQASPLPCGICARHLLRLLHKRLRWDARSVTRFPPIPASPDGINSRKRAYYPISRQIAQGGISQKLRQMETERNRDTLDGAMFSGGSRGLSPQINLKSISCQIYAIDIWHKMHFPSANQDLAPCQNCGPVGDSPQETQYFQGFRRVLSPQIPRKFALKSTVAVPKN